MGPPLLVRLGLREANPWEPPTVLDRFIASPLRATGYFLWKLICWLRSWRRIPVGRGEDGGEARKKGERSEDRKDRKINESKIRVVCISDTHDQIVDDVPAGDLLIHAGDMTNQGTPEDLQRQLDWLAAQPHRHKVVICGNHDSWFDPSARVALDWESEPDKLQGPVFPPNVYYLERSSITLSFPDQGRELSIYGAADIPRCGPDSFAFQYPRESPIWANTIPTNLDILITHPPPRHHHDLNLGCYGLLHEVWRVRPRLHVFGHVHWGAGREVIYWDAAQRAYEAVMDDTDVAVKYPVFAAVSATLGRITNLARLLVYGLLSPTTLVSILPFAPAPSSAKGPAQCTVLINAAQMYGNSGRLGTNNRQVVDL